MNRRSLAPFLFLFLTVAGPGSERSSNAQTPAAAKTLPKELSSLKFEFEVEIAAIQKPIKDLKGNYEKRLKAISADLQRSGDLEGVIAVKAELESLNQPAKVPASGEEREREPRDLENARGIYEREVKKLSSSIERRSEPVAESYQRKLEKLKTDYTRQGQLDYALAADKLIKQIPEIVGTASGPEEFSPLGDWNYFIGNSPDPRGVRTFRKRELIDERGQKHPWEKKGNTIRVEWNQGSFEQLTVDPANPDVLTGVNQSGQRFRYVRKGSSADKP